MKKTTATLTTHVFSRIERVEVWLEGLWNAGRKFATSEGSKGNRAAAPVEKAPQIPCLCACCARPLDDCDLAVEWREECAKAAHRQELARRHGWGQL